MIYTCRCSVDTVWRGPGPARRCAALFGAAPSWALAPCGGCIPQTVKARVLLFANRHGACRGRMLTTRRPAGAWDVLQPCTAPRQACLVMLRSPAGPRCGSLAPGPHRTGPAPHEPLRLRHMWPSIVRCTLQYWRVHQRFLACGPSPNWPCAARAPPPAAPSIVRCTLQDWRVHQHRFLACMWSWSLSSRVMCRAGAASPRSGRAGTEKGRRGMGGAMHRRVGWLATAP